uniref:Large ribosomal subunit protein uL18c n=1 Tax=Tolypiocladia glomerulata TaxID=860646 RepID=A0A1Z1MVM4_9FLOR|nr:ribosomal protein L18 [Tolypiocladia glomerulata]ARW69794.1 ribosomal protein L18 [Tolypiocladia glomerulata]
MRQDKRKYRLYIIKSNKHIYAHLINETNKKIVTSSSTISRDIKKQTTSLKNCNTAKIVGHHIGSKMQELGIKEIVFDRGKNIYHGQIKAIADATREKGIIF